GDRPPRARRVHPRDLLAVRRPVHLLRERHRRLLLRGAAAVRGLEVEEDLLPDRPLVLHPPELRRHPPLPARRLHPQPLPLAPPGRAAPTRPCGHDSGPSPSSRFSARPPPSRSSWLSC